MREVLDDDQSQSDLLHVGGSKMGDLRYADDAVMIFKSRCGLKKYVTSSLNEKDKDYNLKMNASKTNVMAVAREDGRIICFQDECYGSGQRGWKEY